MDNPLVRFLTTASFDEIEAYQLDLATYGNACIRDNKHIPLKDVLIEAPKKD